MLAVLLLRIPEQVAKPKAVSILPHLHRYLDILGFILFAGSVLQLLLALQFGGVTYPWDSSQIIGLFVGAFVTFVVWFSWNLRKGDDALLPYSMISRRAVWSAGLYQGILLSVLYGSTYYLPIYFQAINRASPILSGVYLLPSILPQLVFAAGSGFLCKLEDAKQRAVGIALLTVDSGQSGICYSLRHFRNRASVHRQRAVLPASTWQPNRLVGWLPGPWWCRLRGWPSSGMYLSTYRSLEAL